MQKNKLLIERAELYIKTIQSCYFLQVDIPWEIRKCIGIQNDLLFEKILNLIRPLKLTFSPSLFSLVLETQDKKMLSLVHKMYLPYCLIPAQLYWAGVEKQDESSIIEILENEVLSNPILRTNLGFVLQDFFWHLNLEKIKSYLWERSENRENKIPEAILEICNYGRDYKQVFDYFETEKFQNDYANFLHVNNLAVQACFNEKMDLADKLYALLGYQDLHNMSIHDALDMEYSLVLQLVNDPYPEQYSRFYLERPFPINNLDMTRRTPLDVCRATHHLELEQTLLDKGAKTSAQLRLELLAQLYRILALI